MEERILRGLSMVGYILLVFFAGFTAANAQAPEQGDITHTGAQGWYAYITGAYGAAVKGNTYGLSGTVATPSGWGGTFSYRMNTYPAKNLPGDYREGLCLFGGDCRPKDQLTMTALHVLRIVPLERTKQVRFGAEAGPALVHYAEAAFVRDTDVHNILFLGSNYHAAYTTRTTVGLSVRAFAAFPLSRVCGFEAGLWSNVNSFHSLLGVEGCFTLGLMRDRLPPKRK